MIKKIALVFVVSLQYMECNTDTEPNYCAKLTSINQWTDVNVLNFTISAYTENAIIKYNFTIDVKHDVTKSVFVSVEGYIESKGRKQLLLNKTVDVCKLFANQEADFVIVMLLLPFRQIKTLPHNCPIKQGFYYAYNVFMDTTRAPGLLPRTIFTVKVNLQVERNDKLKSIYKATIIGEAVRKRRRRPCPKI